MNDSIKTARTPRIRPNWMCTLLGLSLSMTGSILGVVTSDAQGAASSAPSTQIDVWTLDPLIPASTGCLAVQCHILGFPDPWILGSQVAQEKLGVEHLGLTF